MRKIKALLAARQVKVRATTCTVKGGIRVWRVA
jgi:hypothetical protein